MPSWGETLTEFCELTKRRCHTFNMSQIFADLPANEKVAFTYDLLKCDDFLPAFTHEHCKNTFRAKEFRNVGNQFFGKRNDTDALKYYTKSVTASPLHSEVLALAYANRSAVLFRLGCFESCLMDINRALNNNYPDSLKHKLHNRREKCYAKMNFNDPTTFKCKETEKNVLISFNNVISQSMDKFKLPEVNFKNDMIKDASEKMKIEWTPEMGRCIVASEDINPGEILVVEHAYASVLLPEFYHSHCSNCFVRSEAPIPCDSCSSVVFCGDNCHQQALLNYHRIECNILSFLMSLEMGKMEMLALRILIVSTKQGKNLRNLFEHPTYTRPIQLSRPTFSNRIYVPGDYSSVHELEDNYAKRSVANLFRRSAAASFLLHALKHSSFFYETNQEFSEVPESELSSVESYCGTLLMKYLLAVVSNAHEISELIESKNISGEGRFTESLEIGAALYPLLSLTNHSCDPNVVRHSYNNNVVLRSIQPIKKGDQLFDNYGYHFAIHSRPERQSHLKEQYYFDCSCEPCRYNWSLLNELTSEEFCYQSSLVDIKKVEECTKVYKSYLTESLQLDTEDKLKFLLQYLCLLHKYVRRPCEQFSGCQEVIKRIWAYYANHYTSNDIIL